MLRTALSLLLTGLVLALTAAAPAAALPPLDPDGDWIPDGQVNALARSGQTLYLAGDFERLIRRTGGGIRLTPEGQVVDGPEFDRGVSVAEPDGAGGLYLGGSFRHVDGARHGGLVHLLADGTLDPAFDAPEFDDPVSAIAMTDTKLYVGGNFDVIDGPGGRGLVRLDRATGAIDSSWLAGVTGFSDGLNDIELSEDGSVLFAGGSFGCAGPIGGTSTCGDTPGETVRFMAAAFSTADGHVTNWNPGAGQAVSAIEVANDGDSVFLAGGFTCVGSQDADCGDADPAQVPRRHVAEVNATNGGEESFTFDIGTPGVNGSTGVSDLLLDANDRLTVAGSFTCVRWNGDSDCTDPGEAPRTRVARVTATGTLSGWAPSIPSGRVFDVARIPGGPVLLAGEFAEVGGQPRRHYAALDPSTGAPLPGDPKPDRPTSSVAFDGEHVFLGGGFGGAGGISRGHGAAIDLQTGEPTAWDPKADAEIDGMALAGDTVYLGGDFEHAGGAARLNIAAVDATSAAATPWAPQADGQVNAFAITEDSVYAGGEFSAIGGDADQPHLAKLSASSGAADPDFPGADGDVMALAADADRLYVGGDFYELDGKDRERLGAVDLATEDVTGFDPQPDALVNALALGHGRVYAGGDFGYLKGVERRHLAALDPSTGALTGWNAVIQFGYTVTAIDVEGDVVGVGGSIHTMQGRDQSDVALLDAADAHLLDWDPDVSGRPLELLLAGGSVYAAGDFGTVGTLTQLYLATFTPAPANLTAPAVTGEPRPGGSVGCDPGRWEGNPVLATTLLLGGEAAGDGAAFTVGDQHVGGVLACRVTARNVRGEASAESPAVEVPRPGGPATGDGGGQTRPAGGPALTLTARTGRGVKLLRNGRYRVR
ncbi:MAG TPA: delta-60 repeat domain-containing protein, partial [Solirubrobacteraceae bacterium]